MAGGKGEMAGSKGEMADGKGEMIVCLGDEVIVGMLATADGQTGVDGGLRREKVFGVVVLILQVDLHVKT